MATCCECRQEKPEAEFYNAKKDRRCKDCARARSRAYAAAHRAERIAYYRKWRKENLAQAAEYQRQWRLRNPRKSKERAVRSTDKKRPYRIVAMNALGRPLKRGEHVHHINCDATDNRLENLFVCSGNGHGSAHTSLWALVKSLMEAGYITFDRGTGVYRLGTPG